MGRPIFPLVRGEKIVHNVSRKKILVVKELFYSIVSNGGTRFRIRNTVRRPISTKKKKNNHNTSWSEDVSILVF